MQPLETAVLGCTGLVGRAFVRRLAVHPWFRLITLAASSRSAGRRFGDLPGTDGSLPASVSRLPIRSLNDPGILTNNEKIIFSALPGRVAGPLETRLRRRGLQVFSNASSHRMDTTVPLLVPEVNPGHLVLAESQRRRWSGSIVTNPNCVVSGLVMTLAPLLPLGLERVHVVTFQALSGAGNQGPRALDMQGNLLPHIAGEEEKIAAETRRILGRLERGRIRPRNLEVTASCCRVPVLHGHLLQVAATMAAPVAARDMLYAWRSFRGLPQKLRLPSAPALPLVITGAADRPQPRLDANAGGPGAGTGMAVTVGRLRVTDRIALFTALVHNLERGAAGAAVLNAELAVVATGGVPCGS